jgi:hypothetical protein
MLLEGRLAKGGRVMTGEEAYWAGLSPQDFEDLPPKEPMQNYWAFDELKRQNAQLRMLCTRAAEALEIIDAAPVRVLHVSDLIRELRKAAQ